MHVKIEATLVHIHFCCRGITPNNCNFVGLCLNALHVNTYNAFPGMYVSGSICVHPDTQILDPERAMQIVIGKGYEIPAYTLAPQVTKKTLGIAMPSKPTLQF